MSISIRRAQFFNNERIGSVDEGDFANTIGARLSKNICGVVFSYLSGEELGHLERRVCKSWALCIESTNQWRDRCKVLFRVSDEEDVDPYLPEGLTYKESYQLRTNGIIGGRVYGAYVGDVGRVPKIPHEIDLRIGNEPDPCDSNQKKYQSYVWMYYPPYIETKVKGYSLNKEDNPNDVDAPRLIPNGTESEGPLLKVPVTINNMKILFERPKKGYSSTCEYFGFESVHGDKRRASGWVCMRRKVLGTEETFLQQQAMAKERNVVIVSLQERILFNFIEHTCSGVYPEGKNPETLARTSTLFENFPLIIAPSSPSDLMIGTIFIVHGIVGLGVALPSES